MSVGNAAVLDMADYLEHLATDEHTRVAALFVENIEFRSVPGPSTRIDITGAFFSTVVDAYPTRLTPHLVVLVRAPIDASGDGTLETVFVGADGTVTAIDGDRVYVITPHGTLVCCQAGDGGGPGDARQSRPGHLLHLLIFRMHPNSMA